MKIAALFGAVVATLLTIAMLFTAGWTHPPLVGHQIGFRGVAMEQVTTPGQIRKLALANALPDAIPAASPDGPRATEVYQNVQVLKDLSVDQFNTLMAAITTWVAPQQGCAYCHNTNNLAEDSVYAKVVARRMIQMTRHINTDWKVHVQNTGVVCWTCHRGNPVPQYIWFNDVTYPHAGGFAATNYGNGHPTAANGFTAMLQDPYKPLADKNAIIRVQSNKELPDNSAGPSVMAAENTYSLMMAISRGMGVNCTYCHNSREFGQWPEATPQRVTAWHGIQMARDLNGAYLEPLKDVYPANRLGPHGDAPKLNCATCHQGAPKPLLGVSIAKDYPELGGVPAK